METSALLHSIDDPQKAVRYLRDLCHVQAFDWSLTEAVASLHFDDTFPQLKLCFKHRIDTCLAKMFDEEADQLMKTLPGMMIVSEQPSYLKECQMLAYRITLLRTLACILRALHNRDTVTLTIGDLSPR